MIHSIPVSERGIVRAVPALQVGDRSVIVSGKFLKIAQIHDESLIPGDSVIDPAVYVQALKESSFKADLFKFSQRITESRPKFDVYHEMENAAVIATGSYEGWWSELSQETRRNVRLAEKRGVVVKASAYDDEFVRGIQGVYNETPFRQGRKFWHYGKSFEKVQAENGTYKERSEFIGAYLGEEMVGFIKMVYVDNIATIMQILSMNKHYDKRPVNALLAKAVQICAEKGLDFLAYCQYVYFGNKNSPLTEFKRRNGFKMIEYPVYYLPLTLTGSTALRAGLHRGLRNAVPEPLLRPVLDLRSKIVTSLERTRLESASKGAVTAGVVQR